MLYSKNLPQGAPTHIIAGLGNFGTEYENTRHNAGFIAIDHFCKENGISMDRQKYKAMVAEAAVSGHRVLLMKPLTYMNDSGLAISEAASFYKIPPENILVLVDDINLAPGSLRMRLKGSAGGQNGLKSIIRCIGSESFPRIRIGIGVKPHPAYDLAAWVLSKFTKQDREALDSTLGRVAEAIPLVIGGRLDDAVKICNTNIK